MPRAVNWSTTTRCSTRWRRAISRVARSTWAGRRTRCRRPCWRGTHASSPRRTSAASHRPRSSTRRWKRCRSLPISCRASCRRVLSTRRTPSAGRNSNMQDPADSSLAGACDCHVHIYDDRFAQMPKLAVIPPRAPVPAYRELQRRLGLERAIIVQPMAYGFDNSCTLDAVAQLGGNARGICLVQPDAADSVISRLHDGGMRGVRFMMIGGPLRWAALEPMAARLAGFDWMINLQLDGRTLPEHEDMLKRLPCTLVIDHNGKFLEPVAPDHPSFQSLLRLLDTGRVWIKLSAPYETSRSGPPGYEDVSLLARTLAQKFPQRCLWASNWPHPGRKPPPSEEALYELLSSWAGTEALRRQILVENPQRLYGFSS